MGSGQAWCTSVAHAARHLVPPPCSRQRPPPATVSCSVCAPTAKSKDYYNDQLVSSSYYQQNLPGGLPEQDPVAIRQDMQGLLRASNATWRIVVGHHSLQNYGKHCGGGKFDATNPQNATVDVTRHDCGFLQCLKSDLVNENVPLFLSGHGVFRRLQRGTPGPVPPRAAADATALCRACLAPTPAAPLRPHPLQTTACPSSSTTRSTRTRRSTT